MNKLIIQPQFLSLPMESSRKVLLCFVVLLPILSSSLQDQPVPVASTNRTNCSSVHVGVILDLGTTAGKRSRASISMAIDEFYKLHMSFSTEVALHFRNSSGHVLGATSAVIDLLTNGDVQALIIGSINPDQAHVIASLGNQAQIPILLLAAQPIPMASFPFLIHANIDEASQATPIAALTKHFGWRYVVPIFEESEYSIRTVFSFLNALQSADVIIPVHVVIPTNASDTLIENELLKLKSMKANIFLTCMMPDLASRLYQCASHVGLMEHGYAWVATNSFASVIETLSSEVIDAMQGVVGIRPRMPSSSNTSHFTKIFITQFGKENPESELSYPTIHDFLAYDATWAVAVAAKKLDSRLCSNNPQFWNCSTNFNTLPVSYEGQKFLDAIQTTKFDNLGINYRLVDKQLQSSSFEIVNVVGKGVRVRGFWSPDFGTWSLNTSNCCKNNLKPIMWPGDTMEVPKSWSIRTTRKKLRIALPCTTLLLPVCISKHLIIEYCKDVFESAIQKLSYQVEYEYISFADQTSYTDIIGMVYNEEIDAFVGDITILANRSSFVEFTQPFTDPGLTMVVSNKKVNKTWRFLEPLSADLWFASLGFFFFTGFVLWAIEHRINPEFPGPHGQQVGRVLYFVFSTLVFSHKENLHSNLSRFAIIIWLFVVLVLTSSYTASFTSMLTVEQLKATSTDVQELIRRGVYVGYTSNIVANELQRIGFDELKLKRFARHEYAIALTQGSENGGVVAIFDELPYAQVFKSNHCGDEYTMIAVKPSLLYTTGAGGFGFVFQKNSPLALDVSKAILELKESDELTKIGMKWFPKSTICQDQGRHEDNQSHSRLSFRSFAGLFIITGLTSGLMLITHLVIFAVKERDMLKLAGSNASSPWQRVCAWIKHFDKKDFNSYAFKSCNNSNQSRVQHLEAHPNQMDGEIAVSTELVITADRISASPCSEQLTVTPTDTDTEMANL